MVNTPDCPRNTLTSANVQRAVMIVASLEFEAIIVYDPADDESTSNHDQAVRLVTAILDSMDTSTDSDMPDLPFKY